MRIENPKVEVPGVRRAGHEPQVAATRNRVLVEDVRLAVNGRTPIEFYGRLGGVVPFPDEILDEIQRVARETPKMVDDPAKVWLQRMDAVVKK